MRPIRPAALLMAAALLALAAGRLPGGEIGSARLDIVGLSLEVVPNVVTGIDIPVAVQTTFGGKTEDAAAVVDMTVAGELIGPGLDAPLHLVTAPGHKFSIPPLHQQGDYLLQNVRLLDRDGRVVQVSVPPSVSVRVVGVLDAKITVRQLTPDDLRARGINIDPRNYDVYDYSMVFAINGQTVTIAYPVVVDKRTHQVVPVPVVPDDHLPLSGPAGPPPRFQPPSVVPFVMQDDFGGGPLIEAAGADPATPARRSPVIPAALVIPSGFGVLHQFFGVLLNVGNNAPAGSGIAIDAITATISTPTGLRVVKVNPAVSIGQPVPIRDGQTNAVFLAAQAQGSADWSLEAMRTGTHTIDVEIHATYKQNGQAGIALKGRVSSTLVVSDPRFQINFVHPDTVRANETYTAYAFITNTSPSQQTVKLDQSSIPSCANGFSNNVCRVDGDPIKDLTFDPGQTIAVPSRLKTSQTGHVYAAAANAPDGVTASVTLEMGVSTSGIPLSPATLVLPWYAQFLNPALIDGQIGFLGLGYSLATAPMTQKLALLPRVIRADVEWQAQAIARAGQRIFITRRNPAVDDPADDREAIEHLSLDLLGNTERIDQQAGAPDLQELDALRRLEQHGRDSAVAIARELERVGLAGGKSASQFVSEFAATTSHRSPYLLVLAHGAPVAGAVAPYTVSVTDAITRAAMSGAAELAGWKRILPNGEITQFSGGGETGQLAMVGRWRNAVDLSITAASPSFQIDLIFPDVVDGRLLMTTFPVSGATPGTPVTLHIERGSRTLGVTGATAAPLVIAVSQTPLSAIAAAQDLHLDPAGHMVSLLFNRPIKVSDASSLRNLIALTTRVTAAPYSVVRKNNPADASAPIVIPGAALQADGKVINISFDHSLSRNAEYGIGLDPLPDLLASGVSFSSSAIAPRIDNDAPGGIVFGRLLRGDNMPVSNATVQLTSGSLQFDTTLADGTFLFEFVQRDLDRGLNGGYNLRAAADGKFAVLDGAIRTAGEVQRVLLQFLGRGSATGRVTYSDGTPIANAALTAASTIYSEFHRTATASDGSYSVGDLPVGPITFAASDASGNLAYAATQIRSAGQSIVQDLVLQKRSLAGVATVRVLVKRSNAIDASDPSKGIVAGAHVGVSTQGYGLVDGITGVDGRFEFRNVPTGFVSILASEFGITRQSAGVDLDLRPDTVIEQTLVLDVPTSASANQFVTVSGTVMRDDPTAPSDRSRDQPVPGAMVTVRGLAPVFADERGRYTCAGVPRSLSDKKAVNVFDPTSDRSGSFALPTLNAGSAEFNLPLLLATASPQGTATLRVRLSAATGEAVTTYRVIWPGFPAHEFDAKGGGIYELAVSVPQGVDVWAVPVGRDARFGDQVVRGTMHADFDGQLSVIDLRLPGQGSVQARILIRKPCPQGMSTCAEEYDIAQGMIAASYRVWSDSEQQFAIRQRPVVATDPVTGAANIAMIPAGETVLVETVDHPSGYAAVTQPVAFEGDARTVDLKLAAAGDVTGRVLAFDGQTPISGATVELISSVAKLGSVSTAPDGSFRFTSVAGNQNFRAVATVTRDGIFRQGYADASTPPGGGPAAGLTVILRQQANVGGTIVDATGASVPLARYWAVGLSWPYQKFGSPADPLIADQNGGFQLNNVFAGPVRVSAASPVRQEERGDWLGTISFENDHQLGQRIVIGGAGSGSVSVTVVDSDAAYQRVANAEVTLLRGGAAFDFGTSDANGVAYFSNVPAGGDYSLRGSSKKVGRAGSSSTFVVTANATAQQQVILDLLGRVSGIVVDGDLASTPPVRGSPVFLSAASMNAAASTGSAGDFHFNGVPEGLFGLEALDLETGRRARTAANLVISKTIQQISDIRLQFDKTATLAVRVYLPDDRGLSIGVLVPLADIKVTQAGYSREAQAAAAEASFARMFANVEYTVEAKELGGAQRVVRTSGTFANGSYAATVSLVLPTSGTVRVQVTADDSSLIAGARLALSAAGKSATVYLDGSGFAEISDLPLGPVSVQVTAGPMSASASGTLASHSIPLVLALRLGSRATIDGYVDAEVGGPSIGTRVMLDAASPALASGLHLDTRTDPTGHYAFHGVPVSSTRVNLTMLGPDEVTVGAVIPETPIADGTSAATMPRRRLDATPPEVVGIDPPNNANSVAPTSTVVVTFSEPLNPGSLTGGSIQLIATDTNLAVGTTIATETINGQFRVRLTPAAPLRSNVLYRLLVGDALDDLSGHKLRAPVASSFTTVNYTEPKIIRVEPATDVPLGDGATFRLKFNKSIELGSFSNGAGAIARVDQLDGYRGNAVSALPIANPYLDPTDSSTLVVAPVGVRIQPSSFYRVTVSGVRDTQQPPNIQKASQSFDYFSFDQIRPVVTIVSPVAPGAPLISDLAYTATAAVADEGTGALSRDTQYVDWLVSDGVQADRVVARAFAAPWGYSFAAPHVIATGTRLTLKASATDLSFNTSDLASSTFDLAPNLPPRSVTLSAAPAAVFLGAHVDALASFDDEGTSCTVTLDVVGKHRDGSDYRLLASFVRPGLNQQITRRNATDLWPKASFGIDLPADLLEGAPLHLSVVVKDSAQLASDIATTDVALLTDTVPPRILSMIPVDGAVFHAGDSYPISVAVTDQETRIGQVAITYDNQSVSLTSGTFDPVSKAWTFTTTARATAKVADTPVRILATAYDLHGNKVSAATEVVYKSVNDGSIPVAQWLTPLDGAAVAAGQVVTLRLRVHATDDRGIVSVAFSCPAFAVQPDVLTAPNGGSDTFARAVTFTAPAETFVITAVVQDADPSHTQTLPISIDVVGATGGIVSFTGDGAITSTNKSTYEGKTVVVSGSATHVYVDTPVTLQNLIVLGGASVGNPDRVRLDLVVKDHLFIEGGSAIDLTGKGYAGGWRLSENGVTRNDGATGVTAGRTTAGGASGGASASYGGAGADGSGSSNATYGSIAQPVEFGSGGSGSADGTSEGGRGGGSVAVQSTGLDADLGRLVIAGSIRADGESGLAPRAGAGSGGSILLAARSLITGPATRITANGGDDDGANNSARGGGGGRIAVTASERFDVADEIVELQSKGGRNGTATGATYLDGGAGTIFIRKPGDPFGGLRVSGYDESSPASAHLARFTPISSANGPLTFDRLIAGPRALLRFDTDYHLGSATALAVDPTAVVLNPGDLPSIAFTTNVAAGASVIQNSAIPIQVSAASAAGVGEIRFNFDVAPQSPMSLPSYPRTVTGAATSLVLPPDARPGPASFAASLTDRAGRNASTAPMSWIVQANAPPAITRFDVTPAAMFAGHSISIDASASDDLGVSSLVLTTSSGLLTSNAPTVTGTSISRSFIVATTRDTLSGTTILLTLRADDNYPTHSVVQQKSVSILVDPNPPSISVTSPTSSDPPYDVSSTVTIPIRMTSVDAEVGVALAWATIDGGPKIPLQVDASVANGWKADIAVPRVDGSDIVTRSMVVFASDYEGHVASSPAITLKIRPVYDSLGPAVTWLCPLAGALFPAGYTAKVRVSAVPSSADNDVTSVSLFVADSPAAIAAARVAGSNLWQATATLPAGAEGTAVALRAVATSFRGNTTQVQTTVTLAAGDVLDADRTIAATDRSLDDTHTLIVKARPDGSPTHLTIDGHHVFQRLIVLDGAVVQHSATTPTLAGSLDLSVTGATYVSCDGAIDASGRGFSGTVNSQARTWPNALSGGSQAGAGGSHGGGGGYSSTGAPAATYGSLFDPKEPGGAGAGTSYNGNCDCYPGGGVIRITGSTVTIDGAIVANGSDSTASINGSRAGFGGGGAGGSIRIDANSIVGFGAIRADGGISDDAGGGGGRVALYQQTLSLPAANITAAGGAFASGDPARTGAPGTVYWKSPSRPFGDLVVDNRSRPTANKTTLSYVGMNVATATSPTTIINAAARFPAPDLLTGIRLVLNGDLSTTWPIAANDATSITVVPGAPFNAVAGTPFRGLYRLDSLKLRSANFDSQDLVQIMSSIDRDTGSTSVFGNLGAPSLDRAKVSITASAIGNSIVGQAGSVSDPDLPITLTATNARTGVVTSVVADRNLGGFLIPVSGNAGDAFRLTATDSHPYPLTSAAIDAGVLTTDTPAASQIPKSGWSVDSSFLARTVALDGRTMAVAGYPTTNGSSDKLVLFDLSDPARPQMTRSLAGNQGAIADIAIANGVVYSVAGRLAALKLGDAAAQPVYSSIDPGGTERAIVIGGGYLFTAEGDFNHTGVVHVYDVTTPLAPRYLRSQVLMSGFTHDFTDLLLLGTDYLIGISNSASGRDVVVIDRRDINNLKKVSDLAIPNFEAFRGTMVGSRLYLSSLSTAEMVVVDLQNPAAPSIAGRAALPAAAGNVAVTEKDALLAGGSAGLVAASSDPAALAVSGSVATGGVAFDLAVRQGYAYVANEIGLVVVPVSVAPRIDASRIQLVPTSATMTTIAGAVDAITGFRPIGLDIKSMSGGTLSAAITITLNEASDGSFNVSLPASAGDSIFITATDSGQRVAGPQLAGTVPFGSAATVTSIGTSGDNFRARTLAIDGSTAVVAGYDDGLTIGASDKLFVFDLSGSAPTLVRSLAANQGQIRDVTIAGGVAYSVAFRLAALNLADPNAVPVYANADPGYTEQAVVVGGGYVFTAEAGGSQNGTIHVYDVTAPLAPRYLRSQSLMSGLGHDFTDLQLLGSDYLIGISNSASGRDVVIIDRRDVNNLVKVAELSIPEIKGFRGRVAGTLLYLAGDNGAAIVDCSVPSSPQVIWTGTTPGAARGVAVSGNRMVVASAGDGVAFYDTTTVATTRLSGMQPTGGVAWDLAFGGRNLYVANDQGLVVVENVGAPPRIDPSKFVVTFDGVGSAIISGAAGAVTGQSGVTALVRVNTAGASSTTAVNPATTPILRVTLPAVPGDRMFVGATDAFGTIAPLLVGTVPFGANAVVTPVSIQGDNFRARTLAVEGSTLVIAGYDDGLTIGASDKLAVFDVSGSTPALVRSLSANQGQIRDVTIAGGVAYTVAFRLAALNLADPNAVPVYADADPARNEQAVVVAGGYAFTAESDWTQNGTIHIYDVTTPLAPRYLRSQSMMTGLVHDFTDLLALGNDYLIAISNSTSGRDVVIIDRRDVNNLVKVSELVIPEFAAFRGRLMGSMLYVTGGSGAAAIDLSNPLSPVKVWSGVTPGVARGVDIAGGMVAIASGGAGIAFFDAANPAATSLLGTQLTGGVAWDLAFHGSSFFAVTDQGLVVIDPVAAPPHVSSPRIVVTMTDATTATVNGSAYAVSGAATSVRATNLKTSAAATTAPAAGGAFSVSIAAKSGERITVTARDAAGREETRAVGAVPFATVLRNDSAAPALVADNAYVARRVSSDGTATLVTSGTVSGQNLGGSGRALLFRQPDASAPAEILSVNALPNAIVDSAVLNGYGYVTGPSLAAINLVAVIPTIMAASANPAGSEGAIAIAGSTLFTAQIETDRNGTIHIYDITAPASPAYVRSQSVVPWSGYDFRALLPYGSQYLIGISPDKPGGLGHDVVVIDRSNLSGLVKIADLDIPAFDGFAGAIEGNTLYVAGGEAGIAIIDLTNPAAPVWKSTIDTPGLARAVAVSRPNEIVVADAGGPGLTFIDTSDRSKPIVLGSQPLDGNATDVKVLGNRIYVATETRSYTLLRP